MERPQFGNPKGWLVTTAIAGAGFYWRGWVGAALLGGPALLVLGLASAMGGNPMFQLLPEMPDHSRGPLFRR